MFAGRKNASGGAPVLRPAGRVFETLPYLFVKQERHLIFNMSIVVWNWYQHKLTLAVPVKIHKHYGIPCKWC